MSKLKATLLTPSIGAELTGLDLSTNVTQDDYDAIYAALIEHQVIFLRNQHISPEAHLNFAKSFGELEPPHPVYPQVQGYPQVVLLENGPDNPPDTDTWHTDETFKAHPPFASILYSQIIPPVGGDTLWASMIAAYAALPEGIKADIDGMRAVHDMSDFRNNFTVGEPSGTATKLNEAHQQFGSAIHPLVKQHPVTGKPFLFVNPGFTIQVVGMTSAASRRLLNGLFDHMNQPEFQVRFKWTENTIAMWDNRCTMHYALNDYTPSQRTMHRVTLINDRREKNNQYTYSASADSIP